MASLIFDLEQGWTKGLEIHFANLKESVALDQNAHFSLKQTHSDRIVDWSPTVRSGILEGDAWMATGDAFKKNRRPLLIKTADCMPLVYVDRENQNVILMHAGWRGLQQELHLQPFRQGLCDPRYTWIWLGPCLNGVNFEVAEDMWSLFGEKSRNPRHFRKVKEFPDKRHFYAWDFIRDEFEGVGVELFYNVEVDTFADRSFVSWRRAKKAGVDKLKVQNFTTVSFLK